MATVSPLVHVAVAAMTTVMGELEILLESALDLVRSQAVRDHGDTVRDSSPAQRGAGGCSHEWENGDEECAWCGTSFVDILAAERGRIADEHIARQRSNYQAQIMRGPYESAVEYGQICHDEPCL